MNDHYVVPTPAPAASAFPTPAMTPIANDNTALAFELKLRTQAAASNRPMASNSVYDSAREKIKGLKFCHFSTAHPELKSRSLHRECMPLAAAGAHVRYMSPAAIRGRKFGIDFEQVPKRTNRLRRVMAASLLVKSLVAQRADVYHFQDTELLPVAFILKKVFRKRIIYDAYEDFPSMAGRSAAIPRILRPLAARVVAGVEQLAARCFDGVMTADPLTMRRMADGGTCRKLVFYNFPNLDFFPPPQTGPKIFDIVYRGGIADRAGTNVLLEAMRLLSIRGRQTRLLLLGYFDNYIAEAALRERICRMGLEPSVELRGRLDHERMAETLSLARIGVSPLQDTPKFRINIPVKIFEYWACGLPVIASDLPPIHPFFRNVRAGLLFHPGDAGELSLCIRWMLDHPAAADRMARRGRAVIAERFNNERESRKFRDFCVRIAGPRGAAASGGSI
jgi:glycosyltransferase involved in cell wall biosynthesis